MKASISCWSFPGGLGGLTDFAGAARQAKSAGFDAIEVAFSPAGALTPETKDADLVKLASAIRSEGVEIAGLATGMLWEAPLTHPDAKIREKGKQIVRRMIAAAPVLGVDAILVVPGAVDVFFMPDAPVVDYRDAWSRSSETIASLVGEAEQAGVKIGIENVWNRFLMSPLELVQFIDQFKSSSVGAYFDVGNVVLFGYPEQWIRALGKRIVRVHVKDFKRAAGTAAGFVDLLAGDVNWPEVTKALREVGYDGYVTAEMIPPYTHYPEVLIENTARALRAIIG
ncbi:MAG TPA: sugar phosphate isomerase/epimerase family protein [Phycisphaerae bacterium]|mgnify:CR=1 FL=1|nr:sugar phosphate isomerase/epimerase family protein [Phycisphaerae bacterium]HOJ72731.1 sugar phosphate isomerase/epimerase family protein [Phycisphaerae bacterium]HOM53514.1 sugar phosphate isomerase/epimerase family protein [Phycisphaerae bacterium]HPU25328.1 sugar phosphate isomerase/epimerase family protein [Phycisphaerae bacterium]HPZ96644.1 sugar phosphate isomerase/epimerase family protein [Phycisphaerae bacterium]